MAPARQDSLLCFRVGGSLFPDPLKLIIWGDSDGEAQRQPFDWRMLASQFPQIEAARAVADWRWRSTTMDRTAASATATTALLASTGPPLPCAAAAALAAAAVRSVPLSPIGSPI